MIKCIIIEDEPLAAEVLQDYIRQVPFLELTATCSDAFFAMEKIQQEPIELIFLDIHLPGLKGLDFLKTLSSPPKVILTTAYHEYALQGYELNVLDYLLKPIAFDRFLMAVNKVKSIEMSAHRVKSTIISIQSEKKKVVIKLAEILFIESQKEYIKIETENGSFKTKYSISKIEEELNSDDFIRVHRAFIIGISKIEAYTTKEIEIKNTKIPIGDSYKEHVMKTLSNVR